MKDLFMLPCVYGVCYYKNKNFACAYVDDSGKQHLVAKKIKVNIIKNNIIFLRGVEYLIFGLYYLIKNFIKFPIDYTRTLSNKLSKKIKLKNSFIFFSFVILMAFVLGILFFSYLPIKLSALLSNYTTNMLLIRLVDGTIKVVFVVIILLVLKLFIPFRQFYRFNACDTNCGTVKLTNFLHYLVFSFLVSVFVISILAFSSNNAYKMIINLIICVFCFSICYEILLLIENSNVRWLKYIFSLSIFLITESPTKTEKYIALSAYNEVFFMKNKRRELVNTEQFNNGEVSFSSVYAECKEKLKNAGIDDVSEADWLLCEVLNINRGQLRLQTKISAENKKKIETALQKRIEGEPISKIFGRTNFYGYDFKVTKDVLSPRQETEILVENALKYVKDKCNVLDMCTGSGIIAICIAKNSSANVSAVDISLKALSVAEENAKNNGVKVNFKQSNLFNNLKKNKKFDIITCNPPYIPSKDIDTLDIEVKNYDPILALDGGEDGLIFYKKIIDESPNYLSKNGVIIFELGIGQSGEVKNLLSKDFEDIKIIKDYNKIERVILAKLKGNKKC